jgi:dTDP-glucose 4,6-dehydratase
MTRVLVSGVSGFVGHRLVSKILERTDWEIVAFDRMNSVLSKRRWVELNLEKCSRVSLIKLDFGEKISDTLVKNLGNDIDYIFHLGAETDINKSITNPSTFIKSNIIGTYNFLEIARKQHNLQYFVHTSTNEVFGNGLAGEKFAEWHKYNCLSPYSATKAASEDMSLAFSSTYQIPVMILRTMNLFGERQDPRKFIPRVVYSILNNIDLPLYTNALGEVGSRSYFQVDSFISAFFYLLDLSKDKPDVDNIDWKRDKFNVAGVEPVSNLVLAKKIAEIMGRPLRYKLVDYYSNQPAHELHSALDCSRLMKLGWSPVEIFEEQLENTVRWLVDNQSWL